MKVLHVQKATGVGGSERHLLSLLPALADAGVEVRLCIAVAGRAREFTELAREQGLPFTVMRAGPNVNPAFVAKLRRELGVFRPDIVHTHLIHADVHGQLAARVAGIAGVSSVHATPSFYRREPYRSLARLAGRSARRTIAISSHVRRFIETVRLAPSDAVRVVQYGLTASDWVTTEDERAHARAELGLEAGAFAVGVASRLVPHKGHSFLLRGFANAAARAPDMRLLIAGEGPLRSELQRQAQGLAGRIDFLGFVADIRRFMAACDVVAFPTQPEFGEGFGLAALEAMAAGRPVVATDVASLPEVVSDLETGCLIDPASVDDLAAALVRLAEDEGLRLQMGKRAHERARRVFSLEAMAQRTLVVYEEALRD